jgi:hypothetical protein
MKVIPHPHLSSRKTTLAVLFLRQIGGWGITKFNNSYNWTIIIFAPIERQLFLIRKGSIWFISYLSLAPLYWHIMASKIWRYHIMVEWGITQFNNSYNWTIVIPPHPNQHMSLRTTLDVLLLLQNRKGHFCHIKIFLG